jgi:hypothetical protein
MKIVMNKLIFTWKYNFHIYIPTSSNIVLLQIIYLSNNIFNSDNELLSYKMTTLNLFINLYFFRNTQKYYSHYTLGYVALIRLTLPVVFFFFKR